MFFSITVPIYNVELYLEECVDSILSQSFTDFELILVDDGSTDRSPELCDAFAAKDSRIKVIHNPNGGASAARNTGMKAAQGQYLLSIDSDDFFLAPDVLQKIHDACEDKDIVLYRYQKYFSSDNRLEDPAFHYPTLEKDEPFSVSVDKLVRADAFFGMAWMKAAKRELVEKNDVYFEEGIVGEDIDWNYKLYGCATSLAVIDESFVAYRQRENSVTSAPKLKSLTSLLYILEKWAATFEQLSDETLKAALLGSLAKHYSNMLIAYTRIQDREKRNYRDRIRALAWLLRHGLSARPQKMGKIYRLLGFQPTVILVTILDKIK